MTTGGEDGERGSDPDATFADVLNGFSFDSGRRRGRRRKHEQQSEDAGQAQDTVLPEELPPGMGPGTGPGMGSGMSAESSGESERTWPDRDDDSGSGRTGDHAGLFDGQGDQVDELSDAAAIVRPYAWTRGRTKANQHLELETLVSTSDKGWNISAISGVEHRSVAELCKHPHAVAEVAAKLSVPLGVARVLLSDMAELGLITVHQTVAEDDDTAAQLMLMERVLSGLRRL